MLLKGFEKPPEHTVTVVFMTTVEILGYLRSYSSLNDSPKRIRRSFAQGRGSSDARSPVSTEIRLRLGH